MTLADFKKLDLPEAPGVYFFRDEKNTILYIGKATILKDRVRSYFAKDLMKTRGLKIVSMVLNALTVTYEQTDSVLEALILETNLIKKYKPVFNTKEKDDSSYHCVVITKEVFPRVLVTRTRNVLDDMKKDITHVFGPFPSGQALKDTLKIIRPLFPYRDTCIPASGIACFNAQIGLCPGVCSGICSQEVYKKQVQNIISFFQGNKKTIIKRLTSEMNTHAKHLEFEQATLLRKKIYALGHIRDSALMKHTFSLRDDHKSVRFEGYDIAHMAGAARVGVMVVVENGVPDKMSYRKFKLPQNINDDYAGLREVLKRRLAHTEWVYPDCIVIDGGPGHMAVAEEVLQSIDVQIPLVSVVKDDRHKAKRIDGNKTYAEEHVSEILLTNSESHRFALSYHTSKRNKDFLKIKDVSSKQKKK